MSVAWVFNEPKKNLTHVRSAWKLHAVVEREGCGEAASPRALLRPVSRGG